MSAALDHERMNALRGIYRQHFRLVWWVVRSSGVPDDSVEDVVHDVFVAAHSRWPAAEEHEGGRWIAGVARSVAYSHRRATARRQRRVESLPEPLPGPGTEEHVAAKQAWSQLGAFLGELDEGQREVFVLAELEGRSAPEIATALGVKLNTVYSRLRLARGRFEKTFAPRPDAAIERARAHAAPDGSARQRTWAAIGLSLGPAVGVGTATAGAALGINAKVAGVVLLGITVLGVVRVSVTPPEAPAARVEAGDDGGTRAPDPARTPASVTARTEPASVEPLQAEEALAASPPIAESAAQEDVARGGARPTAPRQASSKDDPQPSTDLEIELEGMKRAKAHRTQAEPLRALAELDSLDERVKRGALARERLVLRFEVLCDLGRTTEAETLAAGFVAEHPDSHVAPKLRRGCN